MAFLWRSESVGLLNVGNAFLKYAVLSFDGKRPRIIDVKRIYRSRLRDRDIARVLERASPTLFPQQGVGGLRPTQLLLALESSFIRTTFIRLEKKRERGGHEVKGAELDELREAVKRKAVDQREWRTESRTYLFLSPWIEVFSLNGYRIFNPIGKQGEILGVEAFMAAADAATVLAVQRALAPYGFRSFGFFASSLLLARHLSPSLDQGSGLIIDIGGETTDIIFIEDAVPRNLTSFPLGGEEINKRIIQELRLSPLEAEQLKRDGVEKLLPRERQAYFDNLVQELSRAWAGRVLEELAKITTVDFSLSKVALVGGGSAVLQYADALRMNLESWGSFFLSAPEVAVLSPRSISAPFDPRGLLVLPSDMVLASLVEEVWQKKQGSA